METPENITPTQGNDLGTALNDAAAALDGAVRQGVADHEALEAPPEPQKPAEAVILEYLGIDPNHVNAGTTQIHRAENGKAFVTYVRMEVSETDVDWAHLETLVADYRAEMHAKAEVERLAAMPAPLTELERREREVRQRARRKATRAQRRG